MSLKIIFLPSIRDRHQLMHLEWIAYMRIVVVAAENNIGTIIESI